jgi:cupin fold WbuC family metalloprotein
MNSDDLGRLAPNNLREVVPGIFYTDRSFVCCDRNMVEFLKEKARATASKRARLCAHPSAEADQHDMLIVSHRDTYVAPHRHLAKSESMLVLEGCAKALLFSADGTDVQCLPMGSPETDRTFFYRMPEGQYHSLTIESEFLVFVESTQGPFRSDATEFAPWAPAPSDDIAGRAFIARLMPGQAHDPARD